LVSDSYSVIGGIGKRTAIVASFCTRYFRFCATLTLALPASIRLSSKPPKPWHDARANSFSRALPLALAVILAGIRTATIITIGVATIAAAIGAGGLGTFIFRGVALVSDSLILAVPFLQLCSPSSQIFC